MKITIALFSMISVVLLSGCYTTYKTSSEFSHRNETPEFLGVAKISHKLLSLPTCETPSFTLSLGLRENYAYSEYYENFLHKKQSKFTKASLGALFGFSWMSAIVGIGMENKYLTGYGWLFGLSSGFTIAGLKKEKKIPNGIESKQKAFTSEIKAISNSAVTITINNITKELSTNNSGSISINTSQFQISSRHDYYKDPVEYAIFYKGHIDRGVIKSSFDRSKMVDCILKIFVQRNVSPFFQIEARKVLNELVYSDECLSRSEFNAAVLLALAPYLTKEEKDRLSYDALQLGICYYF